MDGLIEAGAVAPALAAEFPALALLSLRVAAAPGRTPRDLRDRLAVMSDRWRGPQALALRSQPVAHAHRVFFRHIGIEPDVQRVPQEEAVVRRLIDGGFKPRGLPADALTIACVETGVGAWACDAARVQGPLALRFEADGRIAVTDDAGPVAPLFGPVDERVAVGRGTQAMRLFAVRVPNVPDVFAREALELTAELLAPPPADVAGQE